MAPRVENPEIPPLENSLEMVFAVLATAQEAAMQRLVPAAVGEHGMDAQVGTLVPSMDLMRLDFLHGRVSARD